MRLSAICLVIGAGLLMSCPLQAADGFLGRWDLSVGPDKRPSWLEVSRDGEKLKGRYVAFGGGVHPVNAVQVTDGKLSFLRRRTRYEATLVDGKLNGTITQGKRPVVTFVGVKFVPKVDVTGTWKIVSNDGYTYDVNLKQTGERVTGTAVNQRGVSLPINKGSLKDGKTNFSFKAEKKGKEIVHFVEAEVHGDRVKGVARVKGKEGTKTFTGHRKRVWGEPIKLFNGKDLAGWEVRGSARNSFWVVRDGVMDNPKLGANIRTAATFRDFKLHIETKVPKRGNSGVYLRGRYEIQIADSHGRDPASGGMGGIYSRITPTSNPSKPAGEWQTLDITIIGNHVTVVLNGETIIDNQEIEGITGGAIDSNETEPGPIYLQGNHGPIAFRNIVLTPLIK